MNTIPDTLLRVEPYTIVTSGGIRIHHLQTGMVSVKQAHRQYRGIDGTGLLAIAADPRWTEWMPITAWVIEHPEGIIVIDTGENYRAVSDPNYFNCDPGTNFFYRSFLRLTLTPQDEIGAQLQRLGLATNDVRWVIQTHLHGDHMGGLNYFPKSQVIVSPLDYPASMGTLPCNYPTWLSPSFTRFEGHSVAGFTHTMPLTRQGDVLIVPTPGHTAGHQSVILIDHAASYFFAGDTSFNEEQLKTGGTAGIAANPGQMRRTLSSIRAYTQAHPTIYLPSHDHDLRQRLQQRQTV